MARLTGDWQRLARHVADRRGALDLTQQQIQDAGGPSTATQSLIEAGGRQSIQAAVAGRLEKALHWEAGSVRAILAGGEPIPVEGELIPTQRLAAARARLRDLTDRVPEEDVPAAERMLKGLVERDAG